MLELKRIDASEYPILRSMLDAYWLELMPDAVVVRDDASRSRYFEDRFLHGAFELYFALDGEKRIGLLAVAVDEVRRIAVIEDFYVLPIARSRGYGRAMVESLYRQLDQRDVRLVELNVRRDNPQALAFWEALGFRIASYHMHQFRDPRSGQSFIGALSSDFV